MTPVAIARPTHGTRTCLATMLCAPRMARGCASCATTSSGKSPRITDRKCHARKGFCTNYRHGALPPALGKAKTVPVAPLSFLNQKWRRGHMVPEQKCGWGQSVAHRRRRQSLPLPGAFLTDTPGNTMGLTPHSQPSKQRQQTKIVGIRQPASGCPFEAEHSSVDTGDQSPSPLRLRP